MALTPSHSIPLGTRAPDFHLPDTVSGNMVSLQDVCGEKGTVVMFLCNHCPFVVHINDVIVAIAHEYTSQGIGFVAISSNDISTHPQDGPEYMKQHAEEVGYPFPYLYDASQEIAKSYEATCTPDIYLFDSNNELYYHGQIDDSRPGNGMDVDGSDLCNALDVLLNGEPAPSDQKPSVGCNIKWKEGC